MILPAGEQEESVAGRRQYGRDNSGTGASGRSPGRLCSWSAIQGRRSSNRSRPAGDEMLGTHLPKQNLIRKDEGEGSRRINKKPRGLRLRI